MRIVVFGAESRLGMLDNDQVLDLARLSSLRTGNSADTAFRGALEAGMSLRDFIESGEVALVYVWTLQEFASEEREELVRGSAILQIENAELRAPWPRARIAAIGSNYAEHSQGMRSGRGGPPPSIEDITREAREAGQYGFFKVTHDVLGPNGIIRYPKRTQYLDYEGELAIVIGRPGSDIKASDVGSYVWGVTLFNDLSIRDDHMTPRPMSYNLNKNFDGSAAMGPSIYIDADLDLENIEVVTTVNGEVRQDYNTSEMIFSFGEIVEHLSRDFTLIPGDVISGGTSAGTAQDSSRRGADGLMPETRFLKACDVVEVASPAIGALRNVVG